MLIESLRGNDKSCMGLNLPGSCLATRPSGEATKLAKGGSSKGPATRPKPTSLCKSNDLV